MTNFLFANPAGAYMQGQQYATQADEMKRQRGLNNVFAEHGAGIAAGDPAALNALAAYDPMAVYGMRRQQKADARADRSEARAEELFQMKVADYKRTLSAEDAAAQAEAIKRGVLSASAAKTPEHWDAIVTQFGATDLVGQFENREALLRQYMTAAQILEADAGPKPADEYQRYVQEEQSAGRQPLSRIEYKRAGQKTQKVTVDGDGNVTLAESFGGADTPPKMTVDAAKNSGFLIRTQEANKVLNDLEDEGLNFWQQNADKVPLGLGNYFRDPEFQKFDQARRDFVNAILRRESGAVISDQEFENANIQYFPVPGDYPEVIAQKRRNRETAIQGLRMGSGPGAQYVDQLNASEATNVENQPAPPPPSLDIPEVPDFSAMSDEDLDAYIKKMGGGDE